MCYFTLYSRKCKIFLINYGASIDRAIPNIAIKWRGLLQTFCTTHLIRATTWRAHFDCICLHMTFVRATTSLFRALRKKPAHCFVYICSTFRIGTYSLIGTYDIFGIVCIGLLLWLRSAQATQSARQSIRCRRCPSIWCRSHWRFQWCPFSRHSR